MENPAVIFVAFQDSPEGETFLGVARSLAGAQAICSEIEAGYAKALTQIGETTINPDRTITRVDREVTANLVWAVEGEGWATTNESTYADSVVTGMPGDSYRVEMTVLDD